MSIRPDSKPLSVDGEVINEEDAVDGNIEDEGVVDNGEHEEAVTPQVMRDPGQLTAREREEHEITHLPPRPWCKWCCFGRGQHDHHRAVIRQDVPEEIAIPSISLDYCFMGNRHTKASDNLILVAFDNRTNAMVAWQVFEKGSVIWVARKVNAFIKSLGYDQTKVTLKSDGERSITSLKNLVAGMRGAPTVSVETPAKESKSNGAMEVRVES